MASLCYPIDHDASPEYSLSITHAHMGAGHVSHSDTFSGANAHSHVNITSMNSTYIYYINSQKAVYGYTACLSRLYKSIPLV